MQILSLGTCEYQTVFEQMLEFTNQRTAETEDQVWLLQHHPVYTQGTACKLETIVPSDIPLVKTDRGGQITYHGPGQLIMYPLIDLKRHGLTVKSLVTLLEQTAINVLAHYDIIGERKNDAPGVYVGGEKIAALGLRIRKGCSYHGLSINVDMDLSPFNNIDPCGYQGLRVTQLSDVVKGNEVEITDVSQLLISEFNSLLSKSQ